MAEHIPKSARFVPGATLPWTGDDSEIALRTRLRMMGPLLPPDPYGRVGVGFLIVTLPTSPEGNEVPIARTACIVNYN